MSPDAGRYQRREDSAASASSDPGGGGVTAADVLLGIVLVILWAILLYTALMGLSEPLGDALGKSDDAGMVAAFAFELYAVALFIFAFIRRVQHGEAAYLTRALAWIAAGAMACINFSSHEGKEAVIFAAASLGAALLAALLEETVLRQVLRRRRQIGPPLPAYPLRMYLVGSERPVLRRAKELAARDPELGLYGSIDQARQELAEEAREAEERAQRADLEQLLLQRFEQELGDPLKARIALVSFDMGEVTSRIRGSVDNKALAERVVGDVTPDASTGTTVPQLPAGTGSDRVEGWPPVGEIHTKPVPHIVPVPADAAFTDAVVDATAGWEVDAPAKEVNASPVVEVNDDQRSTAAKRRQVNRSTPRQVNRSTPRLVAVDKSTTDKAPVDPAVRRAIDAAVKARATDGTKVAIRTYGSMLLEEGIQPMPKPLVDATGLDKGLVSRELKPLKAAYATQAPEEGPTGT